MRLKSCGCTGETLVTRLSSSGSLLAICVGDRREPADRIVRIGLISIATPVIVSNLS